MTKAKAKSSSSGHQDVRRRSAPRLTVTQWFGSGVKPFHVGYYQSTSFNNYLNPPMCYWDGEKWLREDRTIPAFFQDLREWRGLAARSKT